jgi:YegS/Rv2252/BmrU family lipid kinase
VAVGSDDRYGDMVTWLALIVNDGGGSADERRIGAVRDALDRAGLDYRAFPIAGDPTRAAREAVEAGADRLVACGGDGTVGAVAAIAVESDVPLGVVPLGTLNHFARDIGIPDEPEQAVEVLVADSRRRIDVGVANDIVFLNNAGVGSYPLIVHRREQMERRLGKWLAMVAAIRAVFPHRPETIHLSVDGELIDMRATVVFFGNNDYVVEEGRFTRSRLDAGVLSVIVVRAERTWDALRLGIRVARDRLRSDGDLDHRLGTRITLEVVGRNELLLSHDGEVTSVTTPLQVHVRERALEVIAPPER